MKTPVMNTSLLLSSLIVADLTAGFHLSHNLLSIRNEISSNAHSNANTNTNAGTSDAMAVSGPPSPFGLCYKNVKSNNNQRICTQVLGRRGSPSTDLYYIERDADMGEILAGGQRYEMVELPDSMVETTIFVGNLCEFVTDDMLSKLFQQVSSLQFVPACVARKPNMSSLKYGFVTFPTVHEKEAAILRFTGYVLNNKKIKVEEIQDYKFRVRVPEKLVVYTVGEVKMTREGQKNTMRRVSNSRENYSGGSTTGGYGNGPSSSMMAMTSSDSKSSNRKQKNQQKRRDQKKSKRFQSSSSSTMLGSDAFGRDGYKNMKRREKRKNRRAMNNNWDEFGLI